MDKENKIFKPKTPYLYNIGEIINNMEILEQTYCIYKNEARGKAYKVKCLKCRSITTKTEHQLKDNSGCGVCHGRIVIKGINDIATTHPHLVKYFKNPNDAYNVTYSSSKKVDIICPICGKTEKKMSVYNLNKYGYSCPLCGDGISYPEKFISNFLLYLNISFITQLNKMDFKWIGKYRYDFYLPKYNIIIETHGMQHYEENKKFRISLNEQKKIDKIKEDLALSNNIEHYIILDCRESTLNWIKKSIMGSKLSDILNISFDNINWNEIDLKSMQSNVIKACELWNNNKYLTTKNISKILHCSHNTIISYLKKGTNAGICNYSIEEANERGYLYSKKYISKPIFFNGFIYDSATEFSKIIKKNKSTVGNWLLGVPPKGDNEIYSSVHYATEEEMKKYPRYKIND